MKARTVCLLRDWEFLISDHEKRAEIFFYVAKWKNMVSSGLGFAFNGYESFSLVLLGIN